VIDSRCRNSVQIQPSLFVSFWKAKDGENGKERKVKATGLSAVAMAKAEDPKI